MKKNNTDFLENPDGKHEITDAQAKEFAKAIGEKKLQSNFSPNVLGALAFTGAAVATIAIPQVAESGSIKAPEFPMTREGVKAKINWWTDEAFLKDMKGSSGAKIYDTKKARYLKPKFKKFLKYMKENECAPLPQALTGKLSIDFPMVMKHSEKDLLETIDYWIDKKKYSVRKVDGMVNTYLREMIAILELKKGENPNPF